MTWSAWGETPNEPPCTHSVALFVQDGDGTDLVKSVQVPGTGMSAEIDLPDVASGAYYFEVRSACAWQIQLTQSS